MTLSATIADIGLLRALASIFGSLA